MKDIEEDGPWETVSLRDPCPKCGNKICELRFMDFRHEGFVFAVWKCFACGFEIKHEAESIDALINRYVENWITQPTRENAEILEKGLEPLLSVLEKLLEGKFDEMDEETQRWCKTHIKKVNECPEEIQRQLKRNEPLSEEADRRWKGFIKQRLEARMTKL